MQAAEQFKPQPEASITNEAKDVATVDEDSDEDEVDESGVEAKDIELVMAEVRAYCRFHYIQRFSFICTFRFSVTLMMIFTV